jgi:hypothetical protein
METESVRSRRMGGAVVVVVVDKLESPVDAEKRKAQQARYDASEKGKARFARFYASEKGGALRARAAVARKASAEGKAAKARHDKRYGAPKTPAARRWRRLANQTVADAILRGDVARTGTCSVCGGCARDLHHDSYLREDWLRVRELCVRCHVAWHSSNVAVMPHWLLQDTSLRLATSPAPPHASENFSSAPQLGVVPETEQARVQPSPLSASL